MGYYYLFSRNQNLLLKSNTYIGLLLSAQYNLYIALCFFFSYKASYKACKRLTYDLECKINALNYLSYRPFTIFWKYFVGSDWPFPFSTWKLELSFLFYFLAGFFILFSLPSISLLPHILLPSYYLISSFPCLQIS